MTERSEHYTPQPAAIPAAGRPGFVRKLAVLLPLTLLTLYMVDWAVSTRAVGGLEGVARVSDFVSTLTGAKVVSEGNGPRLYDLDVQRDAQVRVRAPYFSLDEGKILPYNHLPFEALLITPLIGLPYGVVFVMWTLLMAATLAFAFRFMHTAMPMAREAILPVTLAAVSYQPLFRSFALGQNSPLVLLGLCGSYVALRRGRDEWAGVALVLAALKPQILPVVGLLLLLQGCWKALLTFAGLLALLCVAAMSVLGPAWLLDYARLLLGVAQWSDTGAIDPAIMHNWRGLATNLFGLWAPALVVPLFALLSIGSVGLLVWAWRCTRSAAVVDPARRAQSDLLWALTGVLAVLTSLHLNPHDLTLLIFPAWIIAAYAASGTWPEAASRRWTALLWAGYALIPISFYLSTPPIITTSLSVLLMALAALFLALQVRSPGLHNS
jgi:hypothetical protein